MRLQITRGLQYMRIPAQTLPGPLAQAHLYWRFASAITPKLFRKPRYLHARIRCQVRCKIEWRLKPRTSEPQTLNKP